MTTPGDLTRAQLIALDMASHGLTQKRIARDMNTTQSAVNMILSRARLKLGALSTPHAIRIAMEAGILRPGNIRGSKP